MAHSGGPMVNFGVPCSFGVPGCVLGSQVDSGGPMMHFGHPVVDFGIPPCSLGVHGAFLGESMMNLGLPMVDFGSHDGFWGPTVDFWGSFDVILGSHGGFGAVFGSPPFWGLCLMGGVPILEGDGIPHFGVCVEERERMLGCWGGSFFGGAH